MYKKIYVRCVVYINRFANLVFVKSVILEENVLIYFDVYRHKPNQCNSHANSVPNLHICLSVKHIVHAVRMCDCMLLYVCTLTIFVYLLRRLKSRQWQILLFLAISLFKKKKKERERTMGVKHNDGA